METNEFSRLEHTWPSEIESLRRVLADAVAEVGRLTMQRDELAGIVYELTVSLGMWPGAKNPESFDSMIRARAALAKLKEGGG